MRRRYRERPAFGGAVFALLFVSCGLVEFTAAPGIAFFPAEANEVVPANTPLKASFDFAVDRSSAESVFTVKDFAGPVAGRYSWEGNSVSFTPEPGLEAGGRYVLSFDGRFKDAGENKHDVPALIPFFSEFRNEKAPYLVSIDPASGTLAVGTKTVRIVFSRTMDRASFLGGFVLNPRTDYDLSWEREGAEAVLAPRTGGKNLTLDTLSFSEAIKDTRGVRLAAARDSVFLVQDDVVRPSVLALEAALNDPLAFFPALGTDLGSLLEGKDARRITFSEPMDRESREAVRLDPDVAGAWYWLDGDTVLVLSPSDFYVAGKSYTLDISSSAADKAGNKLIGSAPRVFTPATAFLGFRAEFAADGIPLREEDFSSSAPLAVTVNSPLSTDYPAAIVFSGGTFATNEEKLAAQNGVSLSCIFPASAASPVAIGASWTCGHRLVLTWTGLEPSSAAGERYYLLSVEGGVHGIRNASGNILRRTASQLIKARAPGWLLRLPLPHAKRRLRPRGFRPPPRRGARCSFPFSLLLRRRTRPHGRTLRPLGLS